MPPPFPRYLSPFVVDDGESRVESFLFMPHAPTDPESAPASLSGLTDEARSVALARFQIIGPSLENGIPLTQVARELGLVLRTARRWVDRYRREGLAGLARKERNDKDKRKLAAPFRQLIEGLALTSSVMPYSPPVSITATSMKTPPRASGMTGPGSPPA